MSDGSAVDLLARARELRRRRDPAALDAFRQAVALDPSLALAWHGLGAAAQHARRWSEAVAALERAVALEPGNALFRAHLGAALTGAGRPGEAIVALEAAIALDPASPAAWIQLGSACQRSGDPDRAIGALERALELRPGDAAATNNLGNLYKETGRLVEAIACYERATAADPALAVARSNRLAALKLVCDRDPEAVLAEHRAWARDIERDVPPRAAVRAGVDLPDRRLRIGYLSPDAHTALPAFVRPVLLAHDRSRFDVYAYYNNPQRPDPPLEACATRRVLAGLDDARAAALIAADDLDLLVDLAGHTGHNRLAVFARRPARVAITWLDYLSTTGLSTVDYRISDAVADPPGVAERAHSERLLRLPVPAWCWAAPSDAPAPVPPPLVAAGVPTYGSFNHALKLTDATLGLWRPLFARDPAARLVAVGIPAGRARERVLAGLGIAPSRAEFMPRLDERGYREAYARADVALDPTPFSGATTTLDALWQGVPVVTLPGSASGSRSTASLLAGIGAGAWIAGGPEGYVALAEALVANAESLTSIRAELRGRVAASSIARSDDFIVHLERAYRTAWEAFCSGALHRDDAVRLADAC
ncbi:MAG: tetratricopeptide repeat protein [Burkholderiales bacterium]